MAKPPVDEIHILRYFEDEPLEKAAIVFKIVSEKMRQRMGSKRDGAAGTSGKETGPAKKRRSEPDREVQGIAVPAQSAEP